MTENELATQALDIAFKIHRQYGPGLFESVYEEIFCYELSKMIIPFKRQPAVPLIHETIRMEVGFRADLIVADKIIIEIKKYRDSRCYSLYTGVDLLKTYQFETWTINKF